MATVVTKTLTGFKALYAGDVGADGAAGTSLTKITTPYQDGVTITGTAPTVNKFYRAGEQFPATSAVDTSSGGIEVTYDVLDFDDATLKFYFGEKAVGGIPGDTYRGEKTFRFDTDSGTSLLIPRLQYVAVLNGGISPTETMRISVTGTVLAPKAGEMAISIIETPSAEPAMAPMSASRTKSVESL